MRSRDFQRRIDEAREEGWSVVESDPERVVLKRASYGSRIGHLLVALATVWWSFGLGNLAYALYEYLQHTEHRVLYAEESDEDPMATLRRRYARGEIDEAELERRAEGVLESDRPRAGGPESVEDRETDRSGATRLERLRDRLR